MENKKENVKVKEKPSKLKIIYAFAVLLAVGGALVARITTEKALGNISVPIESDYIEKVTVADIEEPEPVQEVRGNLENVPDTRFTTEIFKIKEKKEKTVTTTENNFAKPYSDYYLLPLSKDIVKDYSDNKPVYSETMKDWRVHNAVDFKSEEGGVVKSISNGTVVSVTKDVLWGTSVTVDHGNGVTAKYCGFNPDTVEVKSGTKVDSGTVLGYLGDIPCEKDEGPHLHFEIQYKGKTVEPLELMGK